MVNQLSVIQQEKDNNVNEINSQLEIVTKENNELSKKIEEIQILNDKLKSNIEEIEKNYAER